MPLLRGCCTLDLQIGTKIIGVICLIFAILGFIATGIICAALVILQESIREMLRNSFKGDDGSLWHPGLETNRNPSFKDLSNLNNLRQDGDEDEQQLDDTAKTVATYMADNMPIVIIIFLIILAQQFVEIFASSCLIHGIRRNRRGFLMPWIIVHILYLIIELGLIVLFITSMVYLPEGYQIILPMVAIDLIWMALHVYLILVVVSQFQALGLIRMHDEMSLK